MKSFAVALALFVSANAFAGGRKVILDCNMNFGIDQQAVIYSEKNVVLISELTNSGAMLAPRAVPAEELQSKQIKLRTSRELETGVIYFDAKENRWMYKIFDATNPKRVSVFGACS